MDSKPDKPKRISIPRVLSYAALWLIIIGGFLFMLLYRMIYERPLLAAILGALIVLVPVVYFVMSRKNSA